MLFLDWAKIFMSVSPRRPASYIARIALFGLLNGNPLDMYMKLFWAFAADRLLVMPFWGVPFSASLIDLYPWKTQAISLENFRSEGVDVNLPQGFEFGKSRDCCRIYIAAVGAEDLEILQAFKLVYVGAYKVGIRKIHLSQSCDSCDF